MFGNKIAMYFMQNKVCVAYFTHLSDFGFEFALQYGSTGFSGFLFAALGLTLRSIIVRLALKV